MILASLLALSACATTTGANLEDCLRGNLTAVHPEGTWSDPMDSLITAAIDSRRESFYCPAPDAASGGV